jgi:hypothetical protein
VGSQSCYLDMSMTLDLIVDASVASNELLAAQRRRRRGRGYCERTTNVPSPCQQEARRPLSRRPSLVRHNRQRAAVIRNSTSSRGLVVLAKWCVCLTCGDHDLLRLAGGYGAPYQAIPRWCSLIRALTSLPSSPASRWSVLPLPQ